MPRECQEVSMLFVVVRLDCPFYYEVSSTVTKASTFRRTNSSRGVLLSLGQSSSLKIREH